MRPPVHTTAKNRPQMPKTTTDRLPVLLYLVVEADAVAEALHVDARLRLVHGVERRVVRPLRLRGGHQRAHLLRRGVGVEREGVWCGSGVSCAPCMAAASKYQPSRTPKTQKLPAPGS